MNVLCVIKNRNANEKKKALRRWQCILLHTSRTVLLKRHSFCNWRKKTFCSKFECIIEYKMHFTYNWILIFLKETKPIFD